MQRCRSPFHLRPRTRPPPPAMTRETFDESCDEAGIISELERIMEEDGGSFCFTEEEAAVAKTVYAAARVEDGTNLGGRVCGRLYT